MRYVLSTVLGIIHMFLLLVVFIFFITRTEDMLYASVFTILVGLVTTEPFVKIELALRECLNI